MFPKEKFLNPRSRISTDRMQQQARKLQYLFEFSKISFYRFRTGKMPILEGGNRENNVEKGGLHYAF